MITSSHCRPIRPRFTAVTGHTFFITAALAAFGLAGALAAGPPAIAMDPARGAVRSLAGADGETVVTGAGGGFLLREAATQAEIALAGSVEKRPGVGAIFKAAEDGDLPLRAEFVAAAGYVRVNCSLTNLRGVMVVCPLPAGSR